ncbi:MAG: alpha/beta fold hydrolase [Rhodospirillales bacterium]|nr:alpha/beta fold hydrolase [Rhodospirillales bacterium]
MVGAPAALLAACAPLVERPGPVIGPPRLHDYFFHAADGAALPYRVWMPDDATPKAAIVALHGFNDHGNFFASAGEYLRQRGFVSYAYDQRGFGATAKPGLWPGAAALKDDLRAFARLARARHPGIPLYLLGESMGGAVILAAGGESTLEADGAILSAPAVWGRITMPWYQKLALWLGAHATPWAKVTGRGLNITPSDNIEMLLALGRDPLVIKEPRVDAIHGLVGLMDEALAAAPRFESRALILYGQKDEVIPKAPTRLMLERLPESAQAGRRVAFYAEGYHMLLRDLGAEIPWRDIAAWIADASSPLPSGADRVSADAALGAGR